MGLVKVPKEVEESVDGIKLGIKREGNQIQYFVEGDGIERIYTDLRPVRLRLEPIKVIGLLNHELLQKNLAIPEDEKYIEAVSNLYKKFFTEA